MTVLVTTCRTLTVVGPALRGDSKYRIFQSDGEKGDRIVLALCGESVAGENTNEVGIRRRFNGAGSLADCGALAGDGGGREIEVVLEVVSRVGKWTLVALVGTECDAGLSLSNGYFGKLTPALTGLEKMGVRALRKSV